MITTSGKSIPPWHTNQLSDDACLTPNRANSMEVCSSRLLSGYSYDAWSIDMCRNMTVSCGGFSNYYCNECSEDVALEYQLDEL